MRSPLNRLLCRTRRHGAAVNLRSRSLTFTAGGEREVDRLIGGPLSHGSPGRPKTVTLASAGGFRPPISGDLTRFEPKTRVSARLDPGNQRSESPLQGTVRGDPDLSNKPTVFARKTPSTASGWDGSHPAPVRLKTKPLRRP